MKRWIETYDSVNPVLRGPILQNIYVKFSCAHAVFSHHMYRYSAIHVNVFRMIFHTKQVLLHLFEKINCHQFEHSNNKLCQQQWCNSVPLRKEIKISKYFFLMSFHKSEPRFEFFSSLSLCLPSFCLSVVWVLICGCHMNLSLCLSLAKGFAWSSLNSAESTTWGRNGKLYRQP